MVSYQNQVQTVYPIDAAVVERAKRQARAARTEALAQWIGLGLRQPVVVRPIQPGDAGLIDAMHRRLSPDSLYYRYLQPRIPPLAEIEQVCQLEPDQGAGFVATVQQETESIVSLAYYVREPQERLPTAEPAILVEDRFQGQGIGRRLWQHLHEQASANRISRLRVFVEPGNQRMLRLLQGSGFAYQARTHSGLNEYLVALGEPPAQSDLLSVSPLRIERLPLGTHLAQRLVLYPGELYRVPASYRLLRIAAGMAYVTQTGQDHILRAGEEMHLARATNAALVAAVNCEQLMVELFEAQN
jgi:GNAT superfamily N-acetyltransferase